MQGAKLSELTAKVTVLRKQAEALAAESDSFPAVWRNALRILACVRLIELNLGLPAEDELFIPAIDSEIFKEPT